MPLIQDFSIPALADATITIVMTPPVAVGGWPTQLTIAKRFGSLSGFVQKSLASGLNGASGITVVDSGKGIFNVDLKSQDTSGRDLGNYAYWFERLSSGGRTTLAEGYVSLNN